MKKYRKENSLSSDLWEVSKFLSSATWDLSKFLVKNTPKAVMTVAQVKREIIDAVEEEVHQIQKENKEQKSRLLKSGLDN